MCKEYTYIYIVVNKNTYLDTLHIHSHSYHSCMCVRIWQRLKNIGLVTGPGGLFATRLVTESGGLATNPPCDKPTEDYSTLHRGPLQGFVTEGPRQRFATEGAVGTSHSHIDMLYITWPYN